MSDAPGFDELPIDAVLRLRAIMVDDQLRAYLDDIARFPLLSDHDAMVLACGIEDGHPDARLRLFAGARALVVVVASDHAGEGPDILALIKAGNVGLESAIHAFDWRGKHGFTHFATWWIRKEITRVIHDSRRQFRES